MAWVAEPISMNPSAVTLMVTRSSKALPPVHSRKVAMPLPRSRPRAFGLGATLLKSRPVGELQSLIEDLLEAARIVGLRHGVLVGHLLGPDHVDAAHFSRIHLHLAGCRIEQAFDDVDRLGASSAAVGAGRRGIGQVGGDFEIDYRNVIDAGRDPRSDQQLDRHARAGAIGADVGLRAGAQCQHATLVIKRQFGFGLDIAAMVGSQKLFSALGSPFDRDAVPAWSRRPARYLPGRHRSSCQNRPRHRRPARGTALSRRPARPAARCARQLGI